MARPKGAKNKAVKKHVFKDPSIEEVVEIEVEFNCPVRGRIKQKVKVKRLKKVDSDVKSSYVNAQSIIDDLEKDQEEDELTDSEIDTE